jgi:hypothetical protein
MAAADSWVIPLIWDFSLDFNGSNIRGSEEEPLTTVFIAEISCCQPCPGSCQVEVFPTDYFLLLLAIDIADAIVV